MKKSFKDEIILNKPKSHRRNHYAKTLCSARKESPSQPLINPKKYKLNSHSKFSKQHFKVFSLK